MVGRHTMKEGYRAWMSFANLRDDLIMRGERFKIPNMGQIAYDQLVLCGIGVADEATCSLRLVREELANRRSRFISMDEDSLEECKNYLRMEGMYSDVVYRRHMRAAPKWGELTHRTKVWHKLICLHNHSENMQDRIADVTLLLRKQDEGIPMDVAMSFMRKLKALAALYPIRVTDQFLRNKLWSIAEELQILMTEDEKRTCQKELIQDYSCFSDCFRILL
jgi:hypothetical protein